MHKLLTLLYFVREAILLIFAWTDDTIYHVKRSIKLCRILCVIFFRVVAAGK